MCFIAKKICQIKKMNKNNPFIPLNYYLACPYCPSIQHFKLIYFLLQSANSLFINPLNNRVIFIEQQHCLQNVFKINFPKQTSVCYTKIEINIISLKLWLTKYKQQKKVLCRINSFQIYPRCTENFRKLNLLPNI